MDRQVKGPQSVKNLRVIEDEDGIVLRVETYLEKADLLCLDPTAAKRLGIELINAAESYGKDLVS